MQQRTRIRLAPTRPAARLTIGVAACLAILSACGRREPPAREKPSSGTPDGSPPGSGDPSSDEPSVDEAGGHGVLAGRVVYHGEPPATTTMYVAEAGTIEAHTILVDAESRGLKYAAVWLDGMRPRGPSSALEPAALNQRKFTFSPHVLAVRVGQKVRFLNTDIANHNVHSYSPGNEFNLATPVDGEIIHRFRRPAGGQPVRLECDMHPWMLAWVYVFSHDSFGVTDSRGKFRLEDIPAGKHVLHAHHADGGLQGRIDVVIEKSTETHVELEVRASE